MGHETRTDVDGRSAPDSAPAGANDNAWPRRRRGRRYDPTANRHHPAYFVWREMLGRCTNPRRAAYANYGGRGITVCARWRDSFAAFRDDMGPRPAGATIERVDTNGHYEPGNCRWATSREQARNRRDNVWLTYRGETLCLEDWAARVGLGVTTLHYRVHHGWDLESALTTPPRGRRAA